MEHRQVEAGAQVRRLERDRPLPRDPGGRPVLAGAVERAAVEPRLGVAGVQVCRRSKFDGPTAKSSCSDPYATLMLSTRPKNKQRTKTLKKTLSPKWEQAFTWPGARDEILAGGATLEIKVWGA